MWLQTNIIELRNACAHIHSTQACSNTHKKRIKIHEWADDRMYSSRSKKKYWDTNALETAKKKRKKKNICGTKLNGINSCSAYSFIRFGVFVLCRAHFRDYINFQPTTKWGILRHAWEFCRFSICEMQCAVVYRAHALLLMWGKRVNEKEKCNEKEQMNWNIFFFGILVMPHLHVIFVHSPFLGSVSRAVTEENCTCNAYTHTNANIENTIWFACLYLSSCIVSLYVYRYRLNSKPHRFTRWNILSPSRCIHNLRSRANIDLQKSDRSITQHFYIAKTIACNFILWRNYNA